MNPVNPSVGTQARNLTRAFALAVVVGACAGGDTTPISVSASSEAGLTVGGYSCPQTGTIAVSTIPANNEYYITTFSGGTMACGGTADGTSLYIADKQRFGCGTHVRITNPANGQSCVAFVGDYGPNICVEEAASMPIIDASPAIAQALFGVSSSGWSDHNLITATTTTDATGCGTAPGGCTSDAQCNNGQTGTQMVCGNAGTCITGCHANSDCPSGDTCDMSQTTYTCTATPQCQTDADCNNGQTGTQMVCSTSTNTCITGCHMDSDCPSGDVCDTTQATWSCTTAPVVDAGGTPDSGVEPDAGVDAGMESDSGTTTDGGMEPDSGNEPDSGTTTDSGSDTDSGVADGGNSDSDSGSDMDAGSADAGSDDAGIDDAGIDDAGIDGGPDAN